MTRYLLDTTIISNATKPQPSPALLTWMAEQADHDLFISALTIAEIRRGLLEKPAGKKRTLLEAWFSGPDGARYEIFGKGGGAQLAEELGVPLLGQIPLVPAVREGGDSGQPIVVSEPTSEAGEAFRSVARAIAKLGRSRIFRQELKVN